MKDDLERLVKFTEECRNDMHEPDEQNLKARVIGDHLDNACGEHIGVKQIAEGFQEFVIVLEKDNEYESFNLATLIALARKAQV